MINPTRTIIEPKNNPIQINPPHKIRGTGLTLTTLTDVFIPQSTLTSCSSMRGKATEVVHIGVIKSKNQIHFPK